MLCKVCHSIFEKAAAGLWNVGNGISTPYKKERTGALALRTQHHTSTEDMRRSAREGCYICSCWIQEWDDLPSSDLSYDGVLEERLQPCRQYILDVGPTVNDGEDESRETFTIIEVDEAAARLADRISRSSNTGGATSIELASHWLEECASRHIECGSQRDPKWYPTRLLDICGENVRLIETATESPTEPYVTLSHIWGSEPFMHLSTENVASFRNGMPCFEFAKTFCDAMDVVRRLGFRYIWIDSYCILQSGDSRRVEEDKANEISRMRQVYANSYLNIGANSGQDPSAGLFQNRTCDKDGSWSEHIVFEKLPLLPGSEANPRLFQIINEWRRGDASYDLRRSPLFSRGWVVQERILAPRMLHFCESQLFWECPQQGTASEEAPIGTGAAARTWNGMFETRHPFSLGDTAGLLGSTSRVYWQVGRNWNYIVDQYTNSALSRPKEDRQVAIAGLAERVAELRDDEYIAGFFRKTIIRDLCFSFNFDCYLDHNLDESDKCLPGPSWSWVSEYRRAEWNPLGDAGTALARLRSYEVQLNDENNKYSSVTAASLVISGKPLGIEIESLTQDVNIDEMEGDFNLPERGYDSHWIAWQWIGSTPRFYVRSERFHGLGFYELLALWSKATTDDPKTGLLKSDGRILGLVLERLHGLTYARKECIRIPYPVYEVWASQELQDIILV